MNDLLTKRHFVPIGRTGALHGYEGHIRFTLEEWLDKSQINDFRFLYFLIDGMFVPYFVREWNLDQLLISFERIPSREEARFLADKVVYSRKKDLPVTLKITEAQTPKWILLEGFEVWDAEKNDLLGQIEKVIEYPAGWMAEVRVRERPTLLLMPLAEPFIERIDKKNNTLYVRLPAGLTEL